MVIKLLVFAIESTLFKGGRGVYILNDVTEKRQESEINRNVWVFQLLLAGMVEIPKARIRNLHERIFSLERQLSDKQEIIWKLL